MKAQVNANGIELVAEDGGDQFVLRTLLDAGVYVSLVRRDGIKAGVKSLVVSPAQNGQDDSAPAQGEGQHEAQRK